MLARRVGRRVERPNSCCEHCSGRGRPCPEVWLPCAGHGRVEENARERATARIGAWESVVLPEERDFEALLAAGLMAPPAVP